MRSKPWLLRRVCCAPDADLQAMPRSCRTALSDRQLRARRCPWHAWLFSERSANLLKKSVAQPQTKGLRNSLLAGPSRTGIGEREELGSNPLRRSRPLGRLQDTFGRWCEQHRLLLAASISIRLRNGKPSWLIWRASRPQGIKPSRFPTEPFH
jgi:hypothetical protein